MGLSASDSVASIEIALCLLKISMRLSGMTDFLQNRVVDRVQALLKEVGSVLGRADLVVAQKILYGFQLRTDLKHLGGLGVPQMMA